MAPTDLPPFRSLADVEVRKNPATTTWYDATLRDVVGHRGVVSFAGSVWPDREVPLASMRCAALAQGEQAEPFQAGDIIEFRVASSARNPSGWALGCVHDVDGGSLQVSAETKSGAQLFTISADLVRRPSQEPTLTDLFLTREVVYVESSLQGWLNSPDAWGCIENVRGVVGLSLAGPGCGASGIGISVTTDAAGANIFDAVILLGDPEACRRGSMLLQVHMMHQLEVEAFHERLRQKKQKLRDLIEKPHDGRCQVSFEVDAALIGRTMGKKGARAQEIEKRFGVEVLVAELGSRDSSVHALFPMYSSLLVGFVEKQQIILF
eukprot:TRINITY_DN26908_c0_g1_i3.p1 TRINITY_DN26908_c0_g1~~TRINITY_DN26908_c0_g1_i3.p1  ORF type:complete len:344 (-),score=43.54 TRINITY_DN26908_c0_g1_i3:52-1017(-)